jgi:hypothetical protein
MSDTDTQPDAQSSAGPDPLLQTETKLNKGWLLKMAIFFTILLAFGMWGLYDAVIAYPNRGKADAEYRELEYLNAARDAGVLLRASVDQPRAELDRLRAIEKELLTTANSSDTSQAAMLARADRAKLQWLTALSRVGMLSPANTTFENPTGQREILENTWATKTPPKPLSAFDIPSQWLFVIAGFGGALWLTVLFLRVSSKKFRWEPSTRTLTIPGGRTITPADIAEVDKRKWDKFFVTLRLNDSTPAPREHKFDLLRYTPLEAWILELERHSPNYVPPAEEPAETEAEAVEAS